MIYNRTIFFRVAFDNVELTSQSVNDYQKWKFFLEEDGFYSVNVIAMENNQKLSIAGRDNNTLNVEMRSMSNDDAKWKFVPTGDGYYYIYLKARGQGFRINPTSRDNFYNWKLRSNYDEKFSKWKLVSTGKKTNTNIENAYQAWQYKLQQLQQKILARQQLCGDSLPIAIKMVSHPAGYEEIPVSSYNGKIWKNSFSGNKIDLKIEEAL